MSSEEPLYSGHAAPAHPRARHYDSWIEVPSQSPSSSASSVHDEVITHGLRVHNSNDIQRRRQAHYRLSLGHLRPSSATGSSQDEYEESESESDPVMTSSNEDHSRRSFRNGSGLATQADDDEDEDIDEISTALGIGSQSHDAFTPQPNAFSHPPSSNSRTQLHSGTSYFAAARPPAARSISERAIGDNMPPAPSQAADHDAALRASLTTLLSCAAAARRLPKAKACEAQPLVLENRSATACVEPSSLRIIPASELHKRRRSPSSGRRQSSSSSLYPSDAASHGDQNKRKAARNSSKERREVKRLRAVTVDEAISPSLLTWVVSAGVLVLVGALSFSAGYSTGREAGRAESLVSSAGVAGECGRQSRGGLGLRRRLLGGAAQAVSASA